MVLLILNLVITQICFFFYLYILFKRRVTDENIKLFGYYIILMGVLDMINAPMGIFGIKNLLIFHIGYALDFAFVSYMLIKWMPEIFRKPLFYVYSFIWILIIIDHFFLTSWDRFSTYAMTLHSLAVLFLVLRFISWNLRHGDIDIFKDPQAYISFGLLIYSAFNSIVFILFNSFNYLLPFYINQTISIITFILYFYALLLYNKQIGIINSA